MIEAILRLPIRVVAVLTLTAAFGGCFSNNGKAAGSGNGVGAFCTSSDECKSDTVCVLGDFGGRCAKPGSAASGATCAATRDCEAGLYCSALAKCAPAGTRPDGENCSTDGDCLSGRRCVFDGFYGKCGMGGTVDTAGTCATNVDCLAGLWCTTDRGCQPLGRAVTPWEGTTCADDGGFRSYFEVPRPNKPPADFFRLPFPNDTRVTAGALDLADFPHPGPTPLGVDLVQLYVDAWVADFDGFGAYAPVTFRFSGPIDFATATPDAVHLVDVTDGPTFGWELGRGWGTDPNKGKYVCANKFVIGASRESRVVGGHTYVAYFTTALKSTAGVAPAVDRDFQAVIGDAMPVGDAALAHAWTAYAPLRKYLAMNGIAPSTIANASVFTVQNATGHVARLAASLATQPPPALKQVTVCDTGVTSPCDDGTAARACPAAGPAFNEIHGKFSVPIYQQGTAPYDKPADGGGITETGGVPQVARTEDVCFALTLPTSGAAPAAGFPVVVYHHGTGGSMRSFIDEGIADKLSTLTQPAAGFSFDGVEHGARRGASTKKPDDLVFNPGNPRAARDNLLQGAVDILQALRVAGLTVTVPGAAAVTFDKSRVMFFGHSQGATSGTLAMAFAPGVGATVFSGAGAWLTASLLNKTSPVNIAAGMQFLIQEPLVDSAHPSMIIFQSYFERSDPVNYNPLLIRSPEAGIGAKHVYMSWGTKDTYTPRETLEANAQSLGLAPVGAILEPFFGPDAIARPVTANVTAGDGTKRTVGVFQYASSDYDGHFAVTKNADAVKDWTGFFQSYIATGTPSIP